MAKFGPIIVTLFGALLSLFALSASQLSIFGTGCLQYFSPYIVLIFLIGGEAVIGLFGFFAHLKRKTLLLYVVGYVIGFVLAMILLYVYIAYFYVCANISVI